MAMIMDSFREFTGGVVTAGLAARQSRSTSPKGWNSYLTNIGQESATPAKRPGCKTVNSGNTKISADAINCQIEYLTYAAGVPTRYHIGILASGEIGYISSDPTAGTGAWTQIGATTFATNDGKNVGYTIGKNLLFMVDGSVAKKLRGTTLEGIGITRPASAATIAAHADAGVYSGTYELRVTYYNANTDHESSASDSSTAVSIASKKIAVSSIPTSADSQVTARKLYIRNTLTQVSFRWVATISDNVTTTATLNTAEDTLVLLAPSTTQNDPPPSGLTDVAWWQSYLIACDDDNIYWSQRDKPEAFLVDDYEPVGALDGQKITALFPFGDALLIFKTRSVYLLTGRSPASWRLKPLFLDLGCLSKRSIVNAGGAIYWWSHRGPVKWDGSGYPLPIAELLLGTIDFDYETAHLIQGADDATNQMVMWTYPEDEDTENTVILPFNYKLNAFPSNKWDPMNVASLVAMEDAGGKRWVYFGNYNGQFFRFDDGANRSDGVPQGTLTGTFTAGATSVGAITSTGFDTDGIGLTRRIVTLEDANGQYVGRDSIASNTATVLTLASGIAGLTVGATYTFHVGGPNFEWATVPEDSGKPFEKKKFKHIYLKTGNNGGTIGVDVYTDNDGDTPQKYLSFTDDDGEKTVISNRLTAETTGLEWQVIVRNRAANVPVTIYDISMRSEVLNDKIG